MKKQLLILCGTVLFVLNMHCSIKQSDISDAEQRLQKLASKGIPDSLLTNPRVHLFHAKDALQRNEPMKAKGSMDTLRLQLGQLEKEFQTQTTQLEQKITSDRQAVAGEISGLTGMHKQHADSCLRIVDSLIGIKWFLQAEVQINALRSYIPTLKTDEQHANEIRSAVIGKWICLNETTNREDKSVHAVEKKIFTFNKDGSGVLIENKKGKSAFNLKEDWEFVSTGNYDLKGDTIYVKVNRFKIARQDFWKLKNDDIKKNVWVKNPQPTYDSTITDGSQDRFITFTHLKEDFKRN